VTVSHVGRSVVRQSISLICWGYTFSYQSINHSINQSTCLPATQCVCSSKNSTIVLQFDTLCSKMVHPGRQTHCRYCIRYQHYSYNSFTFFRFTIHTPRFISSVYFFLVTQGKQCWLCINLFSTITSREANYIPVIPTQIPVIPTQTGAGAEAEWKDEVEVMLTIKMFINLNFFVIFVQNHSILVMLIKSHSSWAPFWVFTFTSSKYIHLSVHSCSFMTSYIMIYYHNESSIIIIITYYIIRC